MSYRILLTNTAFNSIKKIKEKRISGQIKKRIEGLKENPDLQGKALLGELKGFRSIHVSDERYRIIYKIENEEVMVYIIAIGIRKQGDKHDIYSLLKKLIDKGLID